MPIPESQLMSLSLYNRHFLITSLVALTALACQKEPSADPSQGTSAGTLPSATPVVPAAAATESDKTSADPPRADDSPEIATGAAAASAARLANCLNIFSSLLAFDQQTLGAGRNHARIGMKCGNCMIL